MLKQEYRDDLTLQKALELAINVLSKNMDSTSLTADKLEVATLSRVRGEVVPHNLTASEVESVVAKVNEQLAARPSAD